MEREEDVSSLRGTRRGREDRKQKRGQKKKERTKLPSTQPPEPSTGKVLTQPPGPPALHGPAPLHIH